MKRLDVLWSIIIKMGLWDLLIALLHWSNLITGSALTTLGLITSLITLCLVAVSAVGLVRHPRTPPWFRQRIRITNLIALVIAISTEWV